MIELWGDIFLRWIEKAGSQFVSYSQQDGLAIILFSLGYVAVDAVHIGEVVGVGPLVVVAYHRQVQQVGGFEEDGQPATECLFCRELHPEIIIFPDVVVVPVAHVGKPLADEASGELCVPAVLRVFEKKRQVCDMGRLTTQRACLADGCHFVALHGALVGGDARMGEGVVCLDAEFVEVLQYVKFQSHIVGVAHVHRHIVGVLTFVDKSVFNRVLQMLVEEAGHELFRGFRIELPSQVDVVGHGVLQRGIALLLIFLVDDAVRDNFEEAGAVGGSGVAEPQVHAVGQYLLYVQARQIVGVFLTACGVDVAWKLQGIPLTGVLDAQSGYHLPLRPCKFGHSVSGGHLLIGIIVEGIAHVAELVGDDEYVVKVAPVPAEHLNVAGAGGGVEGIFVEEVVTLLAAIHPAEGEIPRSGVITEVKIPGQVPVGIVFPSA